MLSTVTYALSKKYADKVVEKATDGVVDKAVDKAISKIIPGIMPLYDKVDRCNKRTDQCYERTNENKDFAETIRQGCGRYLSDFKGLGQYIDEKRDPVYAWNGERYVVFSDGVVKRVIDKDYKCRVFNIPDFIETEWVFDAYYKDNAVAILCMYVPGERPPGEIPPDQYVPIYATEVGPIDKTIILDRLRCKFPSNFPKYGSFLKDYCRIILNSYQSEPILYKHKFDSVNVYTKDETDTAIENAINSAITDVINTAY